MVVRDSYQLTFKSHDFLIPKFIALFFLYKAFIGNKYAPNPKNIWFKCVLLVWPISIKSVSNSRKAYLHINVRKYWIFPPDVIFPDALSVIWKSCWDISNSSSSLFSYSYIFSSNVSNVADMGFLQNLILMKSFSGFFLYLIRGMGVVWECTYIYSNTNPFLWDTLFIIFLFSIAF